jgi:hypothetical protein
MSTFQELGVIPEIQRAVTELGFEQPMPVQTEVIPRLLANTRDIIALAQTGTGKTAAFGIPVIQKINVKQLTPQTLILCPTRELCLQIAGDLTDFSTYVEDIKILPVYGGSSIDSQIRTLKRGVHIIVATPGRLIDLIKRKTVSLADVHTMVLDEADEMLNMGFSEDIDEILSHLPDSRSMLLFSATMPKEIEKITRKYMKDPMEITIGRKNEGAENVRHLYFMVHARDKYLALKRIVDYYPNIYGIIFCRTRKETQEIADKLMQDGYDADALHGDLSQAQRDYVMSKYRNPNLQNIPIRDERGREMRKVFIPDEGCLFLSSDYSQIELRIMAHLSGDENMVEAFAKGQDIHAATATKMYKIPLEEVTGDMRRKAKTANFGIIYGISPFGLSERLNIPRGEAKELIDEYFVTFPGVKQYMDNSILHAREKGYVETLFGRKRYLPDINSRNATVRGYAERNAINAPIQGSAADIIKVAMTRIFTRFEEEQLRSKMILQVHDELNFNVFPDELEKVRQIVTSEMENACSLSVPLVTDLGVGENWLVAH